MHSPIILTVTQLNTYSKSLIEQDDNLSNIYVTGEISNFVDHYRSGHLYMSIKDNSSSIKAVMFAGNASKLKFKPENGMSVIIRGRVSIYERDGQYQLYIDDMQPDGVGSLALSFEQLKNKLQKEGLFDASHKKPLPQFPKSIGVISSPTGAAIQDVLNVLNRRFPLCQVVFAGVHVQGSQAPSQIIATIDKLNELNCVDVIIIARGGGSTEDLWQFNDEGIARAIYKSRIPVISGVGHETDYTICDFVSDMRAPTPSAAAEIAVPDINEQQYYISALKNTAKTSLVGLISKYENELDNIQNTNIMLNPSSVIDNMLLYIDSIDEKIYQHICSVISNNEASFTLICSNLESLNPLKVLARGYSVIKKDSIPVKSSKNLKKDDSIDIIFHDGTIKATISEV